MSQYSSNNAESPEKGLDELRKLSEYFQKNQDERNEATTRLQLIDRLFFRVLGWSRKDVEVEERVGGDYLDYTFQITHPCLIVEAKRQGKHFSIPKDKTRRTYRLDGPISDFWVTHATERA